MDSNDRAQRNGERLSLILNIASLVVAIISAAMSAPSMLTALIQLGESPDPPGWSILFPLFKWLLWIVVIGVCLLFLRRQVLRPRSRLRNTDRLGRIATSVSRADEAKQIANVVTGCTRVWLQGESGVGKSTLVLNELKSELKSREFDVVYIDSWSTDWETGVAGSLLAQLGATPAEDVIGQLVETLGRLRRTVLILDHFDVLQMMHRDRLASDGVSLMREELEARSPFLRVLSQSIGQELRCVFVSRLEVHWAKSAVVDAHGGRTYTLMRLHEDVVEPAINSVLTPGDVVEHPEHGWYGLRERLCRDLLAKGWLLPVEMYFAVRGLAILKKNLTIRGYRGVGGLPGLVRGYIDQEVLRISGSSHRRNEVLTLLESLVDGEGKLLSVDATVCLTRMSTDLRESAHQLMAALETARIVRIERGSDGRTRWCLFHEYLAEAVRTLARPERPELADFEERRDRFMAAHPVAKPMCVAGPLTLARALRLRAAHYSLHGTASWLVYSFSFWLVVAAAVLSATSWLTVRITAQREGRDLFDALSHPQYIVGLPAPMGGAPLQADSPLLDEKTLRDLSTRDIHTRRAFLEIGLRSESNAGRVRYHGVALTTALTHMDASELRDLYGSVLRQHVLNPEAPRAVVTAAVRVLEQGGLISGLSLSDTDALARIIVPHLEEDRWTSVGPGLRETLTQLAPRMSPQGADALVADLTQRVKSQDLDAALIVPVLEAVKDKISRNTAATLIATLLDQANAARESVGLATALNALAAVHHRMQASELQHVSTLVIGRVMAESDDELSSLASRLGEWREFIGPDDAAALATHLEGRLARQLQSDRFFIYHHELVSGIAALHGIVEPAVFGRVATLCVDFTLLSERPAAAPDGCLPRVVGTIDAETASRLTTKLVDRMAHVDDVRRPDDLVAALQVLVPRLGPDHREELASRLAARFAVASQLPELRVLGMALGAVLRGPDAVRAAQAADVLVNRLGEETEPSRELALLSGLAPLRPHLHPAAAEKVAAVLLDRLGRERNFYSRQAFIRALQSLEHVVREDMVLAYARQVLGSGGLIDAMRVLRDTMPAWQDRMVSARSREFFDGLARRVLDERNLPLLIAFVEVVGPLTPSVQPREMFDITQRLVNGILEAESADRLAFLVFAFGKVASRAPSHTIEQVTDTVTNAIARETNQETRNRLLDALRTLPDGSLSVVHVSRLLPVLQTREAKCAVVLKMMPDETKIATLVSQLGNPMCGSADWSEIALELSTLTNHSFARRIDRNDDEYRGETIIVDRGAVAEFVSAERHERQSLAISPLNAGTVGLFVVAMIGFAATPWLGRRTAAPATPRRIR